MKNILFLRRVHDKITLNNHQVCILGRKKNYTIVKKSCWKFDFNLIKLLMFHATVKGNPCNKIRSS